jgi:hypothetical protein
MGDSILYTDERNSMDSRLGDLLKGEFSVGFHQYSIAGGGQSGAGRRGVGGGGGG